MLNVHLGSTSIDTAKENMRKMAVIEYHSQEIYSM